MNVKPKVIESLRLKNEDAFNEVYYSYHKLIYFIIYQMVKNKEMAEELMQDAFVRMYQNIHQLNDSTKFHYWFIRLSKNLTINQLKKEKHVVELNEEILDEFTDVNYNVQPLFFDFNDCLDGFENSIITLKFVYDLSFQQISTELGKSTSVITKTYYNALKKLKKQYKGKI